jgi:hypothetical protein
MPSRPKAQAPEPWKAPLRAALSNAPAKCRSLVASQMVMFVRQADFLRKALHVQAALSHADCLASEPQHEPVKEEVEATLSVTRKADRWLRLVFSLTDNPGTAIERQLATKLDISTGTVHRWLSERREAVHELCKRFGKKKKTRVTLGAAHGVTGRAAAGVRSPSLAAVPSQCAPGTASIPHVMLA